MKSSGLLSLVALFVLVASSEAQEISSELRVLTRERAPRTELPIDSPLFQFATELENSGAALSELSERYRVHSRSDGRIKIEAVGRLTDPALSNGIVEALGGSMHLTWKNRASFWIPADRLMELARRLPEGYFLEDSSSRLNLHGSEHSGELHTGADTYIAGGDSGQGISVAVIDIGYAGLTSAQLNGWAPFIPPFQKIDYTGDGFEAGKEEHGNFCLQTVANNAPGAQYWAFRISNLTEFGAACSDVASLGIDITSISLGYSATGWEDDTGSACAAVQEICDAGGLVVNSAGNYATAHWQGVFDEGVTKGSFHDWSPGDELLGIFINEGETLSVTLAWDTSGGTDYDLLLWDNPALDTVAISTNGGTAFESINYPNPVDGVALRFLSVEKISGPDVEFEIICRPSVGEKITLEYTVPGSSTVSPTNTTDPNMISVGAVQWDDYSSAPGTPGIATYYSSRGPTNSGYSVPHLVGPTGTEINDGGTFIGTSCSAPNVAGTAAALWSSAPYLSVTGLKRLLLRQAELTKDWGPAGFDPEFGWGGLWLHPWHEDTVWIDRDTFNLFQLPALPFSRVASAHNFATAGGRLLFLGGNYPEPVFLNKQLKIETVVPVATLGD